MRDNSVRYGELADRYIPLLGCRLQQHQARRRPSTSDIVLRRAYPSAAAGAHFAPGAFAREVARRRDAFGRYFIPVTLQFLCHELCEAGECALSHLRTCDADHASVVRLDRNPDVDFGRRTLGLRGVAAKRNLQSESETAARDGCGADDEFAAREFWAVCKHQLVHD